MTISNHSEMVSCYLETEGVHLDQHLAGEEDDEEEVGDVLEVEMGKIMILDHFISDL